MLRLPDTFTAISWNGKIAGSVDFTALPTKSVDRREHMKLYLALRLWPEYSGLFVNMKYAGQMPSSQNCGRMPKKIPVEINSMETSENQRETQLNCLSTLDVESFRPGRSRRRTSIYRAGVSILYGSVTRWWSRRLRPRNQKRVCSLSQESTDLKICRQTL
jgi:hypothetical protein